MFDMLFKDKVSIINFYVNHAYHLSFKKLLSEKNINENKYYFIAIIRSSNLEEYEFLV